MAIPERASAAGHLEVALDGARERRGEASALATALHVSALAASAGALYALSFPPFSLWLAAWIALVPLLLAVSRVRPSSAALLGLLFSVVATLGVGAWLPDAIARFFAAPSAVGWLAFLAITLVPVGLPIAAFSAWLAWALRRGCASPFSVGAAWAATELLRSFTSLGFLYAPLAGSQVPGRFVQTADVFGVYGVGGLIAAANVVVALAFVPALRRRRWIGEAALVGIACGAALLYGQRQLERSFDTGPSLVVAIVQPGLGSSESAPDAVRARYSALTRSLVGSRPDLVVWPEYAIAAYLRERSPDAEWVRELSRELHADLILGGPHYRYAEPEPLYFTSAFLLREGEIVARHDKTRLVPIAEAGYEPGQSLRVLPGARVRLGAFLCAELLDASVARALVRAGAELLANPANDFWVAPEASAHLLQIAALRAIENRRALVRATPTGFSALIDAHGEIRARSSRAGAQVLEATLHASHAATPSQQLGDAPALLAALFVVGISLRPKLESLFHRRTHG